MVHGDHDEAPLGLTQALMALRDTLDTYMTLHDLNTTPWETTIRKAAGIAGWQHPRRPSGYTATYSATNWWRSWPLDYVLPSVDWTVSRLERLPSFGSDHYPLLADLCLGRDG